MASSPVQLDELFPKQGNMIPTFLVFGASGAGKTSFIKHIVKDSKPEKLSYESQTTEYQRYVVDDPTIYPVKFHIYDTVGTGDTDMVENPSFNFIYNTLSMMNSVTRVDKIYLFIPKTDARLSPQLTPIISFLKDYFVRDYCIEKNLDLNDSEPEDQVRIKQNIYKDVFSTRLHICITKWDLSSKYDDKAFKHDFNKAYHLPYLSILKIISGPDPTISRLVKTFNHKDPFYSYCTNQHVVSLRNFFEKVIDDTNQKARDQLMRELNVAKLKIKVMEDNFAKYKDLLKRDLHIKNELSMTDPLI
jgi:GTPase SAR1 family protein